MTLRILGTNPFESAITEPENRIRFFHAETLGITVLTGLGCAVFCLIVGIYEILRRRPDKIHLFFPNEESFE